MAAPTLQAQGTIAAGVQTGAPTLTIAGGQIPAHIADDILVVVAMAWVPNTTTPDAAQIPTPSTWTLLGTQIGIPTASPRDGWVAAFWTRATGSATTITLTRGAGRDTGTDTCFNARAYVIRGCVTTGNPFDAVATAGYYTAANQNLPAVTVSGSERTVIVFGGVSDNLAFSMASTGWTTGTAGADAGGTDSGFQVAYKENVASSTTAAAATVTAPAAGGYGFIGVSFKPALVAAVLEADVTVALTTLAALTHTTYGFGVVPFGAYDFGYPKPTAAGAEFAADVTLSVSTSAPLTTGITLASAQLVRVTTTAALSTAIPLAGTPTVSIATTAALSTAIRLAVTATVRVTPATGSLSTAIPLAAAVIARVTPATGTISTAIQLAATLTAQIGTSAQLTTAIRLQAAAGLAISTSADLTALTPIILEASVSLQVTTVAALSTAKPLAGTAGLAISTAAPLNTAITAAAAPTVRVTTAGAPLSTAIRFAATTTVQVTTAADLLAGAGVAANISLQVTTSAALSTQIRLASTSLLRVTTSATLTTALQLAATATLAVNTTAPLSTAKPLSAQAGLQISTAGALSTAIQFAAAPTVRVLTAAELSAGISLAASVTVSISTAANLSAGLALAGAVSLQISTAAALTTQIRAAAQVTLAVATAADLSTAIALAAPPALVTCAQYGRADSGPRARRGRHCPDYHDGRSSGRGRACGVCDSAGHHGRRSGDRDPPQRGQHRAHPHRGHARHGHSTRRGCDRRGHRDAGIAQYRDTPRGRRTPADHDPGDPDGALGGRRPAGPGHLGGMRDAHHGGHPGQWAPDGGRYLTAPWRDPDEWAPVVLSRTPRSKAEVST